MLRDVPSHFGVTCRSTGGRSSLWMLPDQALQYVAHRCVIQFSGMSPFENTPENAHVKRGSCPTHYALQNRTTRKVVGSDSRILVRSARKNHQVPGASDNLRRGCDVFFNSIHVAW